MANESSCGGSSLEDIEGLTDLSAMDDKTRRLVKWNTELILGLLKQIVAHRKAIGKPVFGSPRLGESRGDKIGVIDEVKEIIMLPEFEGETLIMQVNPQDIVFDQSVEDEVADYVTTIAMLYRGNSFHNFEHASHGKLIWELPTKLDQTLRTALSLTHLFQ